VSVPSRARQGSGERGPRLPRVGLRWGLLSSHQLIVDRRAEESASEVSRRSHQAASSLPSSSAAWITVPYTSRHSRTLSWLTTITSAGTSMRAAYRPVEPTLEPGPRPLARSRGSRDRCARRLRLGRASRTGSLGSLAGRPAVCGGQPPVSPRRRTRTQPQRDSLTRTSGEAPLAVTGGILAPISPSETPVGRGGAFAITAGCRGSFALTLVAGTTSVLAANGPLCGKPTHTPAFTKSEVATAPASRSATTTRIYLHKRVSHAGAESVINLTVQYATCLYRQYVHGTALARWPD
jgi:hypothetical protein